MVFFVVVPRACPSPATKVSARVESCVKYGVNYWIHMYPFRTMQQGACGNQAYIQNWY